MTDWTKYLKPLSPACKYTPEELKAELIADLEVDLRCAEEKAAEGAEGEWAAYVEKLRGELAELREVTP